MISEKNKVLSAIRGCCILSALILALSVRAAVTVTDENDVIYEIVNAEAMTVNISAKNAAMFSTRTDAIHIPAEVIDHATTAVTDQPYTVIGMEARAFENSAITSITIDAPIPSIPAFSFRNCPNLEKVKLNSAVTSLGAESFKGCASLTSVEGIDGLTDIGYQSFMNCVSLPAFTVPDGVTEIRSETFSGCSQLETITLSPILTKIFTKAFEKCTNLKAPSFPATLKLIDNNAFNLCSSLGRLVLPEGETVIWTSAFQNCYITEIVWPQTPLEKLYPNVFNNNTGLTSVTIPGWLTEIPSDTFLNAADLKVVTFEDGVEKVGPTAFKNCKKLETVNFPENPMEIGQQAFQLCDVLGNLTFPARMISIGNNAFEGAGNMTRVVLPPMDHLGQDVFKGTELTEIVWPDNPINEILQSPFGPQQKIAEMTFPGWMKIIPNAVCQNWKGLEKVTLSEGVEQSGDYAFQFCTAITEVNLPSTLRIINNSSFFNLDNAHPALTHIDFPEGLEVIDYRAFYGSSLTDLEFPTTLTALKTGVFSYSSQLSEVTFKSVQPWSIGEAAFERCSKLTTVDFGNNVTEIGARAFSNDNVLTGLIFPESLKLIGNNAFSNCNSLGEITLLPDMKIDDRAFALCYAGITKINFPETPCTFGANVFNTNTVITQITLPDWMTEIPEGLCSNWSKLEDLEWSDDLKTIEGSAFAYCNQLHDVVFPETVTYIGTEAFRAGGTRVSTGFGTVDLYEGVTIGDKAFAEANISELVFHGCANFLDNCFQDVRTITKIEFPDCMTEIPAGFCNGWNVLTSVKLGNAVTKIGDKAFYKATRLTSFEFPETLEEIGEECFRESGLTSIEWPEHKFTIGKYAFYNTPITSLEIPAWMDNIPENCFAQCRKLEELRWADRSANGPEDILTVGNYAFYQCNTLTSITLPSVKSEYGLGSFALCSALTEINFPDCDITLGDNMFQSCTSLPRVTLPKGVTAISQSCFQGCQNLAEADMSGAPITAIGNMAFHRTGLTSIIWPETIQTLGISSFAYTPLESVTIPETITEIPQGCFEHNGSLKTVTLHDKLTSLGTYAFAYGSSLPEIDIPGSIITINANCFRDCNALETVTFHEGLEKLGAYSFLGCTSLKRVELPSTLSLVEGDVFRGCSAIEEVVNHGEDLIFYGEAFQNCTSLRRFESDGHIISVGVRCFDGCTALDEFVYTSDKPINNFYDYAFKGCSSLKEFNYLDSCTIGLGVFQDCSSLLRITMPRAGNATTSTSSPINTFQNDTNLQSIVWPSTGRYFKVQPYDIANAPLEALSYSYATAIRVPNASSGVRTIAEYEPNANYPTTTPDKSILMVKRGEKWKYVESGYDKLFTIIEMRDPQFNITGDIWSEFDPARKVNHYKALLRWDVPLSDLNPNGSTEVEVFRDDEKIADVVFTLNPEPQHIEGLTSDWVYVVNVSVNGQPNEFKGDFDFPVTETYGGVEQQIWVMQYQYEGSEMYFDAESEKRLVAMEQYGYTSWFTLVDEFDSPKLDSGNVPESYTYTARMKGYSYQEYENNEALEPDADGKRYSLVDKSFESIQSDPTPMYVPFAQPSLSFPGLYTTEEVNADIDRALVATPDHAANTAYKFGYTLDPDLCKQRGRNGNSTDYIFRQVEIHEYNPEAEMVYETDAIGSVRLSGNNPNGTITLSQNHGDIKPGNKYQTVVRSTFRGSFGSPVMTIPDRPSLSAFAVVDYHDHWQPGDAFTTLHATVSFAPEVSGVGYGEGEASHQQGHYYYGIWRSLNFTSRFNARAANDADPGVLVHHSEGVTDEGTSSSTCSDCTPGMDSSTDAGSDVYHDYFDSSWGTNLSTDYTGRLYVKVPKSMIPGQQMWMVSDANAHYEKEILTGVENVDADNDDISSYRWFDIHGIEVAEPVKGVPYIRVSSNGVSSKVILQ